MVIRASYHKELDKLEADVIRMGKMAGDAVKASVIALQERDIAASGKIIKNDKKINTLRYEIEERCLLLIATQQPMAGDLRTIAALLSIITDLERIGDHAEGNARISLLIGDKPLIKQTVSLSKMAAQGVSMLERCLIAFKERDKETAKTICDEDDIVDDLYDKEYRELLDMMIKDTSLIQEGTYMTWAGHNLERVADRVTNIAERVVFMVTGKMEELNVSKY
ncbi:Phosphate transport system regulatory protein PhoU [hydrothermal vent metagenome]|uniref:Phosphate transport system regulatory protein PhoU n=1 Tax=hydrothermal vent metagenome TaxID=652676 RepID=A0A3B0VCX1_9ZZZZ